MLTLSSVGPAVDTNVRFETPFALLVDMFVKTEIHQVTSNERCKSNTSPEYSPNPEVVRLARVAKLPYDQSRPIMPSKLVSLNQLSLSTFIGPRLLTIHSEDTGPSHTSTHGTRGSRMGEIRKLGFGISCLS